MREAQTLEELSIHAAKIERMTDQACAKISEHANRCASHVLETNGKANASAAELEKFVGTAMRKAESQAAKIDQGRGKPRPSGRGQERLAPAASLSMRQRSISWRSAARPAASTFAHCGAVRRMERCSNLSSDGFGGLPTGFFGVSINQLSVMHKFCKSCICVIR